MDLDSGLAQHRGGDAGRDLPSHKVSKGTAIVLDSPLWLAFLDVLHWTRLAPPAARQFLLHTMAGEEALIEKSLPQNFARWQSDRRNQVVFE